MERFIDISRKLGNDIRLVQGAGGNTSIKEGSAMRIKASGYFLRDLDETKGHLLVDHSAIAQHLAELPADVSWSPQVEADYLAALKAAKGDETVMPSLETGFHSVLGNAVLHTHPLAVNAFTCSRDGPAMLRKLYPHSAIIPYSTIGVVLSKAVAENRGKGPIFLLNHGLIAHADTLNGAYEQTMTVVRTLEHALQHKRAPLPSHFSYNDKSTAVAKLFSQGRELELEQHVFPDSAVYCWNGYGFGGYVEGKTTLFPDGRIVHDGRNAAAAAENTHASAYLMLATPYLGGPTLLPSSELEFIRKMESEKYRQSVGK